MALGELRIAEPDWAGLSGTVLSGGYEAGEIIQAHAQMATFRARVLGDWSAHALLNFYCASGPEADEQLALWFSAKELQHQNLTSPWTSGRFENDGASLIYVVVPGADETLAGLLAERPVTIEEAHELLSSLRRGLAYLHGQGWVHGHLSPEQVLAIGDSIRISTELAYKINTAPAMNLAKPKYVAPEAVDGNVTTAADVWCLGATMFEALTQKVYSPALFSEIAGLPAPFNEILEKCLDPNPQTRTRIERIGARATSVRPAPVVDPVPPAPVTATPPKPDPLKQDAPTQEPPKQDPAAPLVARVALRPRLEDTESNKPNKLWIYAAVLAFIVLVLVWAVARPKKTPPPVAAPPQQQAQTTITQPARQAPLASGSVPRTETPTSGDAVWRVVVFTYNRQADAQKKAQLVNKRHPDLGARVFTPHRDASPYLVTVGGRMTKEQAARLRQRIIRLGLPRDSYIQNYKE